jgi:hypothetical protein
VAESPARPADGPAWTVGEKDLAGPSAASTAEPIDQALAARLA